MALADTDPDWDLWTSLTDDHDHVPARQVLIAMTVFCQDQLPDRIAILYDLYAGADPLDLIQTGLSVLGLIAGRRHCARRHRTLFTDPVVQVQGGPPAGRSAFLDWASTDLCLGRYLHRHTAHVDARVGRVQSRMALLAALDRYDRAASRLDGTVHVPAALYILAQLVGDRAPLSAAEIELLTGAIALQGRVNREAFQSMAQALVVYDVVAKGGGGPLRRLQAESLICIQMRFDPDQHRIRAEIESLGCVDDDDNSASGASTLTRYRWLQSKCPGSEFQFDLDLYLEFERYDADRSGKLSSVEVGDMIYSSLVRDYIGAGVMGSAHHSDSLIRSMVEALALEIVQDVDQDGDLHVTWPELRQRSAVIKERCRRLAHWFLDHHLSFIARYFAFDTDLNASLDAGEIQSALLQRLRPLVMDQTLSAADAAKLARDTTRDIMAANDLDGNGVISADEFVDCLHRIAAIEASMLQSAAQIGVQCQAPAISYGMSLPKAKLTSIARFMPMTSK